MTKVRKILSAGEEVFLPSHFDRLVNFIYMYFFPINCRHPQAKLMIASKWFSGLIFTYSVLDMVIKTLLKNFTNLSTFNNSSFFFGNCCYFGFLFNEMNKMSGLKLFLCLAPWEATATISGHHILFDE